MELQDFSDDEEGRFDILVSPNPKPRAPEYAEKDAEDEDPLTESVLTSLVQPQYEEDEGDVNEQDYEPQYSHMPVRRTATRMKASTTGGPRVSSKRGKKNKKKKTKASPAHSLPSVSMADEKRLTENKEETEAMGALSDQPAVAKVLETETERAEEEEDDEEDDEEDYEDEDEDGGEDGNEEDEEDEDDDYQDDDDGENDNDLERELVESNEFEDNMVVEPELMRLREIFDRCLMIMVGRKELGADRLLLVNALRFDMDEGELADEVLVLQSQFISWSTLAGLYSFHGRHGRIKEASSPVADEDDELAQRLHSPPPPLPPPPASRSIPSPLIIAKPSTPRASTPRASTPPREPSPYSSPTHASQHHLQQYHERPSVDESRKEERVSEHAVPLPIPLVEQKPATSTDLLLDSVKRVLAETAAHSTTALALAEEKIGKQSSGLPVKPPKPSQVAKDVARAKVASKARLDATREIVTVELSENFRPPPLSDFALRSGIIFEGWLEKRSRSGIWQRRFCVLAESQTEFCVLRVFGKSNKTSWGEVGSLPKAAIAVITIEKIETMTASDATASGREFTLHVSDCTHFVQDELAVTSTASSSASVTETAGGLGESREICFRADSGAGRLMWVTFIRRAREFALDAYE